MKLTAEQTEDLPFPIGCPVWYNFPDKSGGDAETEEPPTLKQGVVESVTFDLGAKDLIYEVVYRDDDGEKRTIAEDVSERKLAYGADCPVTVSVDPDGDASDEGTVLFCQPSPSDPGELLYAVVMSAGGSRARFESGIDGRRVAYRRAGVDAGAAGAEIAAAPPPAAAGVREERSSGADGPPAAKVPSPAAAPRAGGETVPSSITCDSKGSGEGAGSVGGDKRKRSPCAASPTAGDGPRRPRDADGRGGDDETLELKTPSWLQRNRSDQMDLFFHLIGSKQKNKRGNRTVRHIGKETNCCVRVNFVDKHQSSASRTPLTVSVQALSRTSAARDLSSAREKVQDLLLDHVGRDGARGRLVHEVASSCGGDHRPGGSRSGAVRARDPFAEDGREVFAAVVPLPYRVVGGEKRFRADFLLTSSLLTRLWDEMDCYVKACVNGCGRSGIPTKLCDPYLLVMGKSWRSVDRAVDAMNEVTKKH